MLMVQHCFWSCTGIFLRAKALSPSSVQKNPWSLLGTDRSSKDGFRSALFDVAKSIPVNSTQVCLHCKAVSQVVR